MIRLVTLIVFSLLALNSQAVATYAPTDSQQMYVSGNKLTAIAPTVQKPVIAFTDIISGPDTGLGDGLGSGAIVTVWGQRLGSTQGTSTIQYCDSVGTCRNGHVYYWKNADGQLPSGPANLYESHGMQEIAFSIPDSADGLGQIRITTSEGTVNTPFTVRAGRILHVAPSGNNANTCTFAAPCAFVNGNINTTNAPTTNGLGNGRLLAGDIVYSHGVLEPEFFSGAVGVGMYMRNTAGTKANPVAIVAYPTMDNYARVVADTRGLNAYQTTGIIVSKYSISVGEVDPSLPPSPSPASGSSNHIQATQYGRTVGNLMIQNPNTCFTGWSGAIVSNAYGADEHKMYGNHIKELGCDNSSRYQHTLYISVREEGVTIQAPEISYNYLENNNVLFGIHVYDESYSGDCGDMQGTLKVNKNVITNQRGAGISIRAGDKVAPINYCWTADLEINDNILINNGLGVAAEDNVRSADAILIGEGIGSQVVNIKNNIVWGWGEDSSFLSEGVGAHGRFVSADFTLADPQLNIENNVAIQTSTHANVRWIVTTEPNLNVNNNLFWNSITLDGNGVAAYTNSTIADPLLTLNGAKVSIGNGSPVIDKVVGLKTLDIYGTKRDRTASNLGAVENHSVNTVTINQNSIVITGSGFGTKTQAAPVLAVFGSEIYENGVASSAESGLAQDAAITNGGTWGLTQNVTIDKTDLRAGLVDQMYLGRGDQGGEAIVGWPNAMLATLNDKNSSHYNEKLYTSFYTKFSQSPSYYRGVSCTGLSGTFSTGSDQFDAGETITFDGLTGKALFYDNTNSILHLVVDTSGSSTNFTNKVVTGQTSGATCTAQAGTLYTNPGATKIFRAWENVSGSSAIRTAFSPTGNVIGGYAGTTELYRFTTTESMRPSSWVNWHQVNFYADNSGATGSGYIKQGNDLFSWSGFDLTQKSPSNGLVPANIGFDLSGVPSDVFIKQWFGEIYVDTTPQRVVVADNADYSLATKFDHLIPDSWSDTSITVKRRAVSGYLFIVDANDNPINQTGIAIDATQGSIASVSGSITDGSLITISGVGFGASGPANYMFESYENGTEGSQILATNTNFDTDTNNAAKGFRDTDSRSGNYAASVFQYSGIEWVSTNLAVDFGERVTEAFVSYAVKIPTGFNFPGNDGGLSSYSTDSSMKLGWLLGEGASSPYLPTSGDDDLVTLTHTGGGTWHTAGNDLGVLRNHGNNPSWWKWNQWHRVSVGVSSGADPRVDTGNLYFQVANTLEPIHEHTSNPVIFANANTQTPIGWVEFSFIGWLRNRADQGNVKVLVDDAYVAWGANASARIELGNASTYEACTDLAIIEPTTWSDGQITATVREGGLNLTQNTWLYVTLPDNTTRYSYQVVSQ